MDSKESKGFDFATDTVKQLITLATGIIALTITFLHDILGVTGAKPPTVLVWSWAGYGASVLFGLLTMMGLTGELTADEPSITSWSVALPGMLQVLGFLAGTVLLILFATSRT
jgi:hypothetical protein